MDEKTILQRSENAAFEVVAGEAILIRLDTGTYFSLNKVGTEFWEMLDGRQSISDHAAVIAEKAKPYVDATVSFGSNHWRIAVRNILPNCMAPLIVQATLGFSDGILNVAALGFLGLGAQAPTPEWGVMLADARHYIESAPWLVTLPGLCILIVVLSFNILGDGLRDALDPKLRGQ